MNSLLRTVCKMTGTAIAGALTATCVIAAPVPASAASAAKGRACLFLDHHGARPFPRSSIIQAGHVGWAVKEPGRDRWLWGTMNGPGGPGNGSMGGQISSGTFAQLRSSKILAHSRYEFVRCITTDGGDLSAAYNMHRRLIRTRYNLVNNNCLTAATEILRAYSSSLNYYTVPRAGGVSPTWYVKTRLNGWAGWGPLKIYNGGVF